MRAATELGIRTVAVYTQEDRLSLHRFKADEAYLIGAGAGASGSKLGPIEAYLSVEELLAVARRAGADAVHPGYGLLSENPAFAEACAEAGLVFVGPRPPSCALWGTNSRPAMSPSGGGAGRSGFGAAGGVAQAL